MTMPDLTFCMGKNQAYSHFNLTVDQNWDSIVDVSKILNYIILKNSYFNYVTKFIKSHLFSATASKTI